MPNYAFQSFWVNGLLWKFCPVPKSRNLLLCFNPSGSMDYFGSYKPYKFCKMLNPRFNPSGSMDYFGSAAVAKAKTIPLPVSILLGQWITLEDIFRYGDAALSILRFQSFWVNGLLWKGRLYSAYSEQVSVSILLGQWITLEVCSCSTRLMPSSCFNPSGSMDYFGSFAKYAIETRNGGFNPSGSMDYFGRTLRTTFMDLNFCFNPSGSMDYFGSGGFKPPVMPAIKFQSFWVNGLLWKNTFDCIVALSSLVSILLGQWITLEV